MHYVTSDLHGYPLSSFLSLLTQAHFGPGDVLYILGDVIDRNGEGGIETLRWMMGQENVFFILGNHESFLLACDFLFEDITEDSVRRLDENRLSVMLNWMENGAEPTLASLKKLHEESPEEFGDLLDYLREAPLYDILKVQGKTYILTHAGLDNFAPGKDLPDYTADELLWHRPDITETYFKKATVVFGHTPTFYYGDEHRGEDASHLHMAGYRYRRRGGACTHAAAAGGRKGILRITEAVYGDFH